MQDLTPKFATRRASGTGFQPAPSVSVRLHLQRQHFFTTAFIGAASLLAACDAAHKDVSGEVEYRQMVGAICEVQFPLNAYGVTMNLEREKKTDLVVLTALGLSGPEFTFSTTLGTGAKLQVLAVRKCTNCPFETRIEYQVNVAPEPKQFAGKPVFLTAEPVTSGQIKCGVTKSAL